MKQIQQRQFLFFFIYLSIQTSKERFSLTIYFSHLLHIAQIFFFRSPMSHQVTNISDRRRHGASVWNVHASPDVHREFRAASQSSSCSQSRHHISYSVLTLDSDHSAVHQLTQYRITVRSKACWNCVSAEPCISMFLVWSDENSVLRCVLCGVIRTLSCAVSLFREITIFYCAVSCVQ